MWFDESKNKRIPSWRAWRESIKDLSEEEIVQEIASAWGQTPEVLHYLVPDNTEDWPDAWHLIQDNMYCDLAKVLGMYYSARLLLPHFDAQIKIFLDKEGWVNLLYLDGEKYVLNWSHAKVVNIITNSDIKDLTQKFCYTSQQLPIE